ncbi:hypothetical protein COP2_041513 [Malus domestica]
MMASISPSAQNEREQWSIQILRAPKREMPSPSDLPRQPTWVGLEAMLVLPAGLQWCTWMLTPRPSMVLKLLTMNSYLSLMVMSAEKLIQKGFFWMTAWRSVPGVGFAGLESEESVTGM